jgi:hypothetical protein
MPPSLDTLVTDDAINILTNSAAKHTTMTTTTAQATGQTSEKRESKMYCPLPPFPPLSRCAFLTDRLRIDRGVLKSSVVDEDFYITCEQAEVTSPHPLSIDSNDQILLGQFQQDNQSPIIHVRLS